MAFIPLPECPKQRRGASSRRRHRGVGLVEMLVALTIAAGLLTATAVAVHASFQAYRVNQELSSLSQRGRLAMHRMLTTIRAAERHLPDGAEAEEDFKNGLVVTDAGIAMQGLRGEVLVYRHDPAAERLIVEVNGVPRVLLEGVGQFQVRMEPMRSPEHARAGLRYDLLRRATILMTLHSTDATESPTESTGRQSLTLSSSAAPRRNTW